MKTSSLLKFSAFGISTILLKRKKPILGTIIVTDKCNLTCKHCAVNNVNSRIYKYQSIKEEMVGLYNQGIRILFLCGGETFLWEDDGKTIRDLVKEAKEIGFLIVNVVTNGTYKIDLPEADLILLSLDGNKKNHNFIRGNTFDLIMKNIDEASSDNICLYMAINNVNRSDVRNVADIAREHKNIRAISFNFHTPYKGTENLKLTRIEKREVCDDIEKLIDDKYPIFNLRSAFKYIVDNDFSTPCHQCVVVEEGRQYTCGRCIEEAGLCEECGYFFAAEYALVFKGKIKVIIDMLKTYLKYI